MSNNRSFVASIAARYGPRLRRFLSVRLRNAADVPDLAQEVFLRLLRVEGCESIRSPEAYLFTIASHVIHQHAVRRSSEPVAVDIAEVFSELRTPSSDDPSNQVAHAQRLDELERMLACLPARVATALVLHRVGDYSVQEVGDELGVSRETAKKYLARAVEHCRNRRASGSGTSGNAALKPEQGDTYTLGVNFAPSQIAHLSGSIDYFHIRVKNEVGTIPYLVVVSNCANTGDPTYCSQIVRSPSTGSLTGNSIASGGFVIQKLYNLGTAVNSGIDVQMSYKLDLPPGFGAVSFALNGAYLLHNEAQPLPGALPRSFESTIKQLRL